jgi:hypothetical protein
MKDLRVERKDQCEGEGRKRGGKEDERLPLRVVQPCLPNLDPRLDRLTVLRSSRRRKGRRAEAPFRSFLRDVGHTSICRVPQHRTRRALKGVPCLSRRVGRLASSSVREGRAGSAAGRRSRETAGGGVVRRKEGGREGEVRLGAPLEPDSSLGVVGKAPHLNVEFRVGGKVERLL